MGWKTGRRGWVMAGLILLLAGSFWVRERGIEWPLLHPDEYKITRWANWIEAHSQTENAAYPGGFFHLVKPLLCLKTVTSKAGEAWSEFQGHRLQPVQGDDGQTFFLRKINVILAVLTVGLVFGIASRVSGSNGAGLVAAGLLAFSRLHVEHSHYAETDIAMLFTLTLALYLWVRVVDSGKSLWFGLAALMTGLAIGTKYTNLLLLVQAGVGGWYCWRGGERKTMTQAAQWFGLGLLLVACGWCYTNRHVFEGGDFWHQLHQSGQAAYAERSGILGASAREPLAALRSNWNILANNLTDVHWGWLIFMGLGAGFSFVPRYRRYGAFTLLPLGLYLIYCLKFAPWIRDQECLVFIPFLTVCLAIGVKESVAWANRTRYRFALLPLIALTLLMAGGDSVARSLRFASLCEVPDPRVQAMRWLYCHAPLHKITGIEDYTVPACRLFDEGCSVEQIEWVTEERRARLNMDYLLRNVSSCGRGTVDPRTGELYPNYSTNWAGFKQDAHRLCEWGPREPHFAFVGHQMEWWEARQGMCDMTLRTPMFRPVFTEHAPSVMVPLSESEVGSGAGLFVDTIPRSLIVSGSSKMRRPIYVVLQTRERAGEVIVDGMGDRHVVPMDPFDVKVVEVRRPWYWPRLSEYDELTLRVLAQPHVEYLPCYAQAVTDVRDVALLLYQKGYPDHALEWLARSPVDSEEAWLAYACAVAEGQKELADHYEPLARQALADFEKARAFPPERLLLNGATGAAFRDHARMRLPLMNTGRDGLQMTLPDWVINLESADTTNSYFSSVKMPVRLAPGKYTVQGRLSDVPPFEFTQPWHLNMGDTSRTGAVPVVVESGQRSCWSYSFEVCAEQDLELTFTSPERGGRLALSGLEIQWSGDDLLWAERRELYKALIRHALQRGQLAEARQWLESARHSVSNEVGWQMMEREFSDRVASSNQSGIVFYPWLKLVKAEVKSSVVELQFTVLKEPLPALEVNVYRKNFQGPKKFHKTVVNNQFVRKGTPITLEIPLSKPCPVSDLYVRIQAAVEWGAAPLRVEGVNDGRVRLTHLP